MQATQMQKNQHALASKGVSQGRIYRTPHEHPLVYMNQQRCDIWYFEHREGLGGVG